jgi:hypothetical protein
MQPIHNIYFFASPLSFHVFSSLIVLTWHNPNSSDSQTSEEALCLYLWNVAAANTQPCWAFSHHIHDQVSLLQYFPI